MAIKNFSTSIDSYKTISEIQQLLAKKGAQQISIKNDGKGNPIALTFLILWGLEPIKGHQICHSTETQNRKPNNRCKGAFDHNLEIYKRMGLEHLVK